MQNAIVVALTLTIGCCATALAQTSPAGNWSASYTDASGNPRDADIVIAGDKGTLRIFAQGKAAARNPCLARDLPVAVQSAGDDLTLVVSASQAMRGCEDFTAMLKRVDDNSFDGTIADSRKIHITRK